MGHVPKTKLEHLLEASLTLSPLEESESDSEEIDTLDAHSELIKMRDQLKAEKQAIRDQVSYHKIDIT